MKKILLLSLFATLICNMSFAKIFRIGYTGPHITGVDFSDILPAHDAANAGDTLLFFPSTNQYSANASKRLVYIGYGYFVEGTGSNPNLQLLTGGCLVVVNLETLASGSVFEGIEYLSLSPNYNANVNDIVVRRCKGTIALYSNAGTTCNNWQFSQCFDLSFSPLGEGGKATNVRLDNCKIANVNFINSSGITGQFNNCVFQSAMGLENNVFNFQNCIFYNTQFFGFANSLFQNNLFSIANSGFSGTNNQYDVAFDNADVNNVFIGFPFAVAGQTDDGKYKLKPASPAIGAGIGGVDLGIFGGINPYRLSGIPATPAFYKLTAPTPNATTNPYTITFSVRSNN